MNANSTKLVSASWTIPSTQLDGFLFVALQLTNSSYSSISYVGNIAVIGVNRIVGQAAGAPATTSLRKRFSSLNDLCSLVTSGVATSSELTSVSVTTSPVTSGAVTSSRVTTSPVTTSSVTTAPITSSKITTAQLTSAAITTGAIPVTTGVQPVTTEAAPITTAQQLTTGVVSVTSGSQPGTSGQLVTTETGLTSGVVTTSIDRSEESIGNSLLTCTSLFFLLMGLSI